MYQQAYSRFSCDKCGTLIMRSQPILVVEEHSDVLHFCSEECKAEHDLEQVVAFVEGE